MIDTGCDWAPLICVSKHDVLTDGTARRILSYNLARQANCKGRESIIVTAGQNECWEP